MNFEEFIEFCDDAGWGIAAFNTYVQYGVMFCYLMVAEKGNDGHFVKCECVQNDLSIQLEKMANRIKNILYMRK